MEQKIKEGDLVLVRCTESPLNNEIYEVSEVVRGIKPVYLITGKWHTRWYFDFDELELVFTV